MVGACSIGTAAVELFDGAYADAVRLPQGTVDRTRLGDSHLRTVYLGRDIGGIGVSVADKTFALRRGEDSSLE